MSTIQTTPTTSAPDRPFPRLTASQKQAVIDNLTLEVSERARKLRAQYTLHAEGLKSRLEMRVNRVPKSIKSMPLITLLDEHHPEPSQTKSTAKPVAPTKAAPKTKAITELKHAPPARTRGTKRTSDEMTSTSDDKENVDVSLALPKKRTKAAAAYSGEHSADAAPTRGARTASKKIALGTSQVLSPRSTNPAPAPRVASKASTTSVVQKSARAVRAPADKKPAVPKAAPAKAETRKAATTKKAPAAAAATAAPVASTRSLRSRK